MSARLCLCGCGRPPSSTYRVVRGHGGRVKPIDRPEEAKARRSLRYASPQPKTPKTRPRNRVCLRCDKKFSSWGIGNRLCQRCRDFLSFNATPARTAKLPGQHTTPVSSNV